jgi:hypothetical protein
MPQWWNGRRGGLKIRYREVWGFKSLLGHHLALKTPAIIGVIDDLV